MRRLFNICLWACALALVSCINDPNTKQQDNTPSAEKGALVLNVATRTAEGEPQRDYILCIYKNEEGKQTLVRKYDSSKEDMQKPEYIWLLEGNYKATIESGAIVANTFNQAEQHFVGEEDFEITGGKTTTVDLVAVSENIPVEVVFDQTIIDGFHEGYKAEVKANSKVKLTYTESKTGYFIMPNGVTALSWHFTGTFEYKSGEQVEVDKSGTIENVQPKHAYKLTFKFSKDANGFLGDLKVEIDDSIEERDDHIAFTPDPELKGEGFDLNEHHYYAGGERKYTAKSIAEFVGVTLSSNGKTYDAVASSVPGVTVEGLGTTQLAVTLAEDFFYMLSGGRQDIELCVSDISGGEARKDLPYTLPGVNAYDNDKETMSWAGGTSALSATIYSTPTSVEIGYREGEGEWKYYTASASGENTYEAAIDGLAAYHTYEYSLRIDGKSVGSSRTFTTRDGNQIPNGNMELWSQGGNTYYPGQSKDNTYWDSGNGGTTFVGSVQDNLTSKSTDTRPGSKGRYSAFLDSKVVMSKFAAGNIFIGKFGEVSVSSMSASVYFGQPFTYNAKPVGIKMWVKYNCGSVDNRGDQGPAKGESDLTKIFCCMCNWSSSWCVDSSKVSTTTFSPDMESIKNCTDDRYKGVLYTAYFESRSSNNEWHELYIPFEKVEGTDESVVPNYIVLTATCSGYGDYFTGSTDSWMYVDDVELVY